MDEPLETVLKELVGGKEAGGSAYEKLQLALLMETRADVKHLIETVAVLEDRLARRGAIWGGITAAIVSTLLHFAVRAIWQ